MASVIRETGLENGLTIRFLDLTRHYFGDFHLVKIEIVCEIPLLPDYFADPAEHEEARRLIGAPVVYRRTVEQMGVPSTAIGMVTDRLIANFTDHSLSYFSAPGFPARFVRREFEKARKQPVRTSRFAQPLHD